MGGVVASVSVGSVRVRILLVVSNEKQPFQRAIFLPRQRDPPAPPHSKTKTKQMKWNERDDMKRKRSQLCMRALEHRTRQPRI